MFGDLDSLANATFLPSFAAEQSRELAPRNIVRLEGGLDWTVAIRADEPFLCSVGSTETKTAGGSGVSLCFPNKKLDKSRGIYFLFAREPGLKLPRDYILGDPP